MNNEKLIELLNSSKKDDRLSALADLKKAFDNGSIEKPQPSDNVNNHIHTKYSFSPYSPSKAIYAAYMNGLSTAGIMDHDSVGGAHEFAEAGKMLGIATTAGIEARVGLKNTIFEGKKINNPDQVSVIYCSLHGIPSQNIDMINGYFAPFRFLRNERNRKIYENIRYLMKPYGIKLDFDNDVLPLSYFAEAGSVTERHVFYALAKKLAEKYPSPSDLINFFTDEMKITISDKNKKNLLDCIPEFYLYDILGILKSDVIDKVYVDADDECPHIEDFAKISRASGAIMTYPYLGDIGDSVTGDKKPQKFEDDFLEALIPELKRFGFKAITFMPTRNTKDQLKKLINLCRRYNMFQVSGEDINSPRQSFICEALKDPLCHHLIGSTWALIGHERAAEADIDDSMFSHKTELLYPNMDERVEYFKEIGLSSIKK